MQSVFDFDKAFDEIICEKEAEINRLKNVVEQLETRISKQERLQNAKDTFISTTMNIAVSNSKKLDGMAEYKTISRMWLFERVQKLTNFIELFKTPCIINEAKQFKFEITKFAIPYIESTKDTNANNIIMLSSLTMKSFYTAEFYKILFDLYDSSGVWSGEYIIRTINPSLKLILYAIVDYLDKIIKEIE